jgi:hypothetical protein
MYDILQEGEIVTTPPFSYAQFEGTSTAGTP